MLRRKVSFITSKPPLITITTTIRQKSSGGKRPKKKIYHRVPELDRVMELRKKPTTILELKTLIQSQPKSNPLFLRDLEKNVGFVRKWDFMALIEKHPTIFRVTGSPPFVHFTDKAHRVAQQEARARDFMEPLLVNNLRKMLMLCVDNRIPLETVEFVGPEMGLPWDFKGCLIDKYPQFFSVRAFNGRDFLYLEDWDSTLAVTAREARLAQEGIVVNMKPNMDKKKFERWQKLEFPSPYLNARRFDTADPKTRKRALGVIHELLSLTMERRMTSAQLDAFHAECFLPSQLLLCLIKHHGIFYLTNKGVRSTVFLKDGYVGSNLIDKCPLLQFNDKFVALCGRGNVDLSDIKSSLQAVV
ncbi:unnamed protein product [Vicia faba]|uniref:PORR domain-containing protein n=1 Tax=Vicia faba TaxID=3906 RepID=A0AAV1APG6_VICFA|nr:unnamed protein product [Vicia faba]